MQKKWLVMSLLGVSAAAIGAGAGGVPSLSVKTAPVTMQSAYVPAPVRVLPPAQPPMQQAYAPPSAIQSSLARWNSLRQSDNNPFYAYSSFLLNHRGWPGETALRRSAEKAIGLDSTPANEVVTFFRAFPPLSPTGHARHAFALLATGQVEPARQAARTAWAAGVLPAADESRLLSLFGGALKPVDHDARMETLLANRDTTSAGRMLAMASLANRALYEARLALQTNSSNAASQVAALGNYPGHAGLLQDRANWLRGSGQSLAARQLLASRPPLTVRPANPETWFETLLTMARGAAEDNQWSAAYQIASNLDQAYPPGTDVSARPYGERDAYTSLAWLAGTAAMNKLGRPADAARAFERYARAAKSPQTRAKGFYWAARAAGQAGQAQQSAAWLEEAAASPDQFYGQLAIERLGRRITPPVTAAMAISPAARASFTARPLAQAMRALGEQGRWTDQSLFVRALAEQLTGTEERMIAADWGRAMGRPDLGVWIAREARNKGETFYMPGAFPEVQIPSAYMQNWSLAHGITRQESSFDRMATSHVGARGMMQLMPATAREVTGKLGLSYDLSRLTSDPAYNIMLGSSYFGTLLNQWGGNVPLAVASYNAGAGNVRKWVRAYGDPRMGGVDIVQWIEQIPFSETRNYVQRVLENAVVYDAIRASRTGGAQGNRLSYYLGQSNPG
jgi:soluble lytic murein transglycosylase